MCVSCKWCIRINDIMCMKSTFQILKQKSMLPPTSLKETIGLESISDSVLWSTAGRQSVAGLSRMSNYERCSRQAISLEGVSDFKSHGSQKSVQWGPSFFTLVWQKTASDGAISDLMNGSGNGLKNGSQKQSAFIFCMAHEQSHIQRDCRLALIQDVFHAIKKDRKVEFQGTYECKIKQSSGRSQ